MKQLYRLRHRHFLEDQGIQRWYDNLCRGSKVIGDVYLRRFGFICETKKTIPKELVEYGRHDEQWLYNFAIELVTHLEKEGKAGSCIASNLKAIRCWLSYNGIEFRRKIKV